MVRAVFAKRKAVRSVVLMSTDLGTTRPCSLLVHSFAQLFSLFMRPIYRPVACSVLVFHRENTLLHTSDTCYMIYHRLNYYYVQRLSYTLCNKGDLHGRYTILIGPVV